MPDKDLKQEFAEIVRRADAGDTQALEQLRAFFDVNPHVWRLLGDVAKHAEEAVLGSVALISPVTAEALRRKLADLRIELGYESAPVLEQLLIERLIVSWAQCYTTDVDAAVAEHVSPGKASYLLKAQSRAHQRLLSSVRMLVTVKKLLKSNRSVPPLALAASLNGSLVGLPDAVAQRRRRALAGTGAGVEN